jgi:ABC-2 type transport system permease protein
MNTTQPMRLTRVLRAYLMEARFEFLRMTRAPIFVIPMLLLPPLLYFLFGVLMAASPDTHAPAQVANFLFVGFAVFAVLGPALFGVGCPLAVERDQGLLRLKRAMPVPTGAYLLAKVLMAMAFAAIAAGSVALVALIGGKITLSVPQVATIVAVLVAGTVPFCALGLFVGTRVSGSAAPGVTNLAYFPMIYLAGLFFPLPKALQPWAVIWPTFHLSRIALAAGHLPIVTAHGPVFSVAILVGITILFGGAALRRLSRVG